MLFAAITFDKGFFKLAPKYVDWNTQEWIEKELLLRDDLYQEVTINLNEFKTIGKFVHQIAIMPVPDITDAEWQIESVTIN